MQNTELPKTMAFNQVLIKFKDLNQSLEDLEKVYGRDRLIAMTKTQVELGEMCLKKFGEQPAKS